MKKYALILSLTCLVQINVVHANDFTGCNPAMPGLEKNNSVSCTAALSENDKVGHNDTQNEAFNAGRSYFYNKTKSANVARACKKYVDHSESRQKLEDTILNRFERKHLYTEDGLRAYKKQFHARQLTEYGEWFVYGFERTQFCQQNPNHDSIMHTLLQKSEGALQAVKAGLGF